MSEGEIKNVPIDKVKIAKENMRFEDDFGSDTDKELVASVAGSGIYQAPLARYNEKDDVYEVFAGSRRVRAAQEAGKESVDLKIYDVSDLDAILISVQENWDREDVNPLKMAAAIRQLVDKNGVRPIARKLHKSPGTISTMAHIVDLPRGILIKLEKGLLKWEQVRRLVYKDPELQKKVAEAAGEDIPKLLLESGVTKTEVGAPSGKYTVRFQLDPKIKKNKTAWKILNDDAAESGVDLNDFIVNIVMQYVDKVIRKGRKA